MLSQHALSSNPSTSKFSGPRLQSVNGYRSTTSAPTPSHMAQPCYVSRAQRSQPQLRLPRITSNLGQERRHQKSHASQRARQAGPCRSFEPNSPEELDNDVQRVQPTLIRAPSGPFSKVNTAYLSITGVMMMLLVFKNPYIYAALVIAAVIPQNSNVTSLNTLVVWFYETGLFMNFAEAVTCVRLVTWLSITFCLLSFALFT